MIAKVRRQIKTPISSIGDWYINNIKLDLFSLEDRDRNLSNGMSLVEIKGLKVKAETAIPTTSKYLYEVELYKSPKFTKQFGQDMWMLHLLNVPGFDGVLVHPLNTADQTEACLGVGMTKSKNFIGNSRVAYKKLLAHFAPVLGFTISMKGTFPIINPIKGFEQIEKLYIAIESNY